AFTSQFRQRLKARFSDLPCHLAVAGPFRPARGNNRMLVDLAKQLALGGMLLVATSWPSQAHDIYAGLKDSAGSSCCHDRDCRPARYRTTAAGVEMLVDGKWIVVPNETIQYRTLEGDTGETAGGHWCGVMEDYSLTICAVLPPSSASASGDHGQTSSAPNSHPAHR